MKGQGLLVANEISRTRVRALRENLERWGVTNSLITNEDSANLAKAFPHFFDLILVDAPCSGEGMFRKIQMQLLIGHKIMLLNARNVKKKF